MPDHQAIIPAPELTERAAELLGRKLHSPPRLVTDTGNFINIVAGDVIDLQGRRYLVRGNEYEGRFSLDDEPKHWVKRCLDWETGQPMVVKLVFHEQFDMRLGRFTVRCYRSPAKEARILALTQGDTRFMQGWGLDDAAGNLVRVIQRIQGQRLDEHIKELGRDHQAYFQRWLRPVLTRVVELCRGIGWLHLNGERHGDVRRDHVLVEHATGHWRWIDFDYNFDFAQNPFGLDLFGLGNVLVFAVAGREPNAHELKQTHADQVASLTPGDFSPVIPSRVVNLRRIYPYLPLELNRVLMHFAAGAPVFYQRVEELLADLEPALALLPEGECLP